MRPAHRMFLFEGPPGGKYREMTYPFYRSLITEGDFKGYVAAGLTCNNNPAGLALAGEGKEGRECHSPVCFYPSRREDLFLQVEYERRPW